MVNVTLYVFYYNKNYHKTNLNIMELKVTSLYIQKQFFYKLTLDFQCVNSILFGKFLHLDFHLVSLSLRFF